MAYDRTLESEPKPRAREGAGDWRASGPIHGVGLGLRTPHYRDILERGAEVPFFEVMSDNYAHGDGPPLHHLERIRERHPVVFHGVGMSLGGADPLDRDYLQRIRALARRFEPAWISEHLAWTALDGRHHHELLPLPMNEESVALLARHIAQAQDFFGERILVENAATYLAFESSTLSEAEFVCAVAETADCDLLLDVNNVYVNAFNHGYDAEAFLRAMPRERVRQFHLAGFDDHGHYLIDAHGAAVAPAVWQLYERALELFPETPTLIEWDRDVPPFDVLLQERRNALARGGACRDAAAGGAHAA